MTTPDVTGGGRPLRTAAIALLSMAAIALLIGLVSVTDDDGSNGGDGVAAGPTSASAEPDVTSSVSAPDGPGTGAGTAPARPTLPTATVPPSAPPPSPADVPAAGNGGGGEEAKTAGTVRIYNNSTVRGLAARAAEDMRAEGWTIEEVGNYSGGIIPTTTVYYQNHTQRSAAEALADQFGMRVEPRFDGIREATPGLIVIVTSDYSG